MGTFTTEIRQPFSLPIRITVPDYPRLMELKSQVERLTGAVNDSQSRLATLTRERMVLDQKAESTNVDQQVFERIAQVKREINQAERELAGAQSQAARVADELQQWRDEFGWKLYRRRLLAKELAEMAGTGPTTQMITTPMGGSRPRTRLEILIDLDQTVGWLGIWSGDPALAQEATTVKRQLAEAYQQA